MCVWTWRVSLAHEAIGGKAGRYQSLHRELASASAVFLQVRFFCFTVCEVPRFLLYENDPEIFIYDILGADASKNTMAERRKGNGDTDKC